ncbi:Bifunctional epoxide hydrolase 2 [Savitreella phatthalungensis]
MPIKAIVFDIGGVCVDSPLHAINAYEKRQGLPHNYLNYMIAKWKTPSPFHELELGNIAADDVFFRRFSQHLSDPEGFKAYCKRFPDAKVPSNSPVVDGKELFDLILKAATKTNDHLLPTIRQLKKTGNYKIWALTNNFPVKLETDHVIHPLFDRVIGSIDLHMRKPDPRIYDYLLKELALPAEQVVFLDDIGANLKSAKNLGINTIQVDFRTTPRAVKQLYDLLDFPEKERLQPSAASATPKL